MYGIINVVLVSLFIALVVYISIKSKTGHSEFTVANRDLNLVQIVCSYICNLFSGSTWPWWFMFVGSFAFGSLYIQMAILLAFVVIGICAPRANAQARQYDYHTLPDMITHKIGPLTSRLMQAGVIFASIVIGIGELYIAGKILSAQFGLSFASAAYLMGIGVYLYVARSGMRSVVNTDVAQAALISIICLCAWLFVPKPPIEQITSELLSPNFNAIAQFAILGFVAVKSDDLWPRIFAAKDGATARNGTFLAVALHLFVAMVGVTLAITYVLSQFPNIEPQKASSVFFEMLEHESLLTSMFGLVVIIAIVSSLDNVLFTFSTVISKNIYGYDPVNNADRFVNVTRWYGAAITLAFATSAMFVENLMEFMFTTYGGLGTFAFCVLYAVWSRRSDPVSDKIIAIGCCCSIASYVALLVGGYLDDNQFLFLVPHVVMLAAIGTAELRFILPHKEPSAGETMTHNRATQEF
jgi:Na+/proline symporter